MHVVVSRGWFVGIPEKRMGYDTTTSRRNSKAATDLVVLHSFTNTSTISGNQVRLASPAGRHSFPFF
jgi:hypothetical protein